MSECGLRTSKPAQVRRYPLQNKSSALTTILSVKLDDCPSMHVSVTKAVKVKLRFFYRLLEKNPVSSLHAEFH